MGSQVKSWTDSLHTLPVGDCKTLFGQASDRSRNACASLDGERKHVRRVERRAYLNMLRVANAAQALDRLPEPGETFHVVMAGNFDAFDLVPAVLRLAAPATIAVLNIATLGFNQRNTATLVALLDDGQVGRCTFICSTYFRSMSDGEPVYDELYTALTTRPGGHRIAAIRSHAKILLFELTDGRCFTWESSANLRSCRNIEQATLTHDRDLLDFHREWILEVLADA